ncbi:MAG: hypothetical protein WBA53_12015 [Burkholderiaceae bacterium]
MSAVPHLFGVEEGFDVRPFVRAGLVVDDPAFAIRRDERAIEHQSLHAIPLHRAQAQFAAVLGMWTEDPASAVVLDHVRQRLSDSCTRGREIVSCQSAGRKNTLDLRHDRLHSRGIPARKRILGHPLQPPVHHDADASRRLARPRELDRGMGVDRHVVRGPGDGRRQRGQPPSRRQAM